MDLADQIDPESGSGLCAICDNAVEEFEPHAVVAVHGGKYLCHAICLEDDMEPSDV